MKSSLKNEPVVVLELDWEETQWLRDLMQNPLDSTPEEEDARSQRLRMWFFNAIATLAPSTPPHPNDT